MAGKQRYTVAQVIEALTACNGLLFLAAEKLGCAISTIGYYQRRYAQIRQVVLERRGRRVDIAEAALDQAVLRGESWAITLTLKTLGKDRGYVEKTVVEGGDKPVVLIDWDSLVRQKTPAQIDEVEERLRREEALPAVAPPLPNGLKEIAD